MAGSVTESLHLLLASAIDYAGLFPPAELDMERAAARYAEYRCGEYAWMLGSFVAPASRLAELERFIPDRDRRWPVAALAGPALDEDLRSIESFNARAAGLVSWIEARVSGPEQIRAIRARVPADLGVYFEIADPALIEAVSAVGSRAKLRTGGVTAEAFPAPAKVAQFLAAAAGRGVAFKLTAGLHHPVRGEHALTYREDSPRSVMHGFLNVLLAAVFARTGVSVEELSELLEERSVSAWHFAADGISWRYHRITNQQIREARTSALVSFGSCSFNEPVSDLQTLGLL